MTTAVSSAAPVPPSATAETPRDPRLWQAAQDFEAVLLGQLTKHMFDTDSSSEKMFDGGVGEETWRGVLAEQLGKDIGRRGGIGLADSVYREMLRMQEAH